MPSELARLDPPAEAADTPNRLLDAAEALVAERGIDAVSIRAVNVAAGRNPAAVHYHFGSKQALVEAVLERRMAMIAAARMELLAPLEGVARPTARNAAEVIILPLADIRRSRPWGSTYVRFLHALMSGGPRWRAVVENVFARQNIPMQVVLARSLAHVPEPIGRFRLELVVRFALGTLADLDEFETYWPPSDRSAGEALTALIDAATAVLEAPAVSSHEPTRS